jgi:predicted TIM-barrel fold metal-dependent hydrolase
MSRRWFAEYLFVFASILCATAAPQAAGDRLADSSRIAVIDMHLHAVPVTFLGAQHPAAKKTDEQNLNETLAEMKRWNIVKAVASGPIDLVLKWKVAAGDRIIASPMLPFLAGEVTPAILRGHYQAGRFGAMGEITAQYGGLPPTDALLEPYYALAEEFDVPVGIHMGLGPRGAAYTEYPRYRMSLSNPLLLEEVLLRHPKMRVYVMHAGWPFVDDMIGLLHAHPQVHVDVGVIDWYLPRQEFHNYLRRLVEAGFDKRIMFGSDQMLSPNAIGRAIEAIEAASFLTATQKADIFYNNAARFLRLGASGTSK